MDFRWSRTSAERVSSSSIKRKLGSIYRDRRGARRGAAISAARDRGDCHHHRNSPGKVDISSAEPNKIDRRRACSAGIPYDLRITIKAPSRNPHPPSETGNKAISKAGGIVATHWPKESGAPALCASEKYPIDATSWPMIAVMTIINITFPERPTLANACARPTNGDTNRTRETVFAPAPSIIAETKAPMQAISKVHNT
jgi:hypothetical protein